MTAPGQRDHGGGLDAAVARFGGDRDDWIDLSTGINPWPYPLPTVPDSAWHNLPDSGAMHRLLTAARRFWDVPDGTDIVAASGVSALITQLPALSGGTTVTIAKPTYNEHEAAFAAAGHTITDAGTAQVFVHPNNPDGRLFGAAEIMMTHRDLTVIDESFCDCTPDASLVDLAEKPGVVVLKGLGKFWGLAGMRLGFAIARPETVAALRERLGPWAVSGPALHVGAEALEDRDWTAATRQRLHRATARLDGIATDAGLSLVGGTDLFRLYACSNSDTVYRKLAAQHILTRTFPYSKTWIRLGLPGDESEWQRLSRVLGE